nr:zinc finger, CCHC-type [Tanacetum cinerariifolium]
MTDKVGEYMNALYFQSVGIIHETTASYTPQQNGISERKNKVLKEMVNSMLSYSGLSQGFLGVIEPNDLVLINSITESKDAIFDENRFSPVPRPSLRIPNRTEDIGGSVVLEEDDPKTFDEAMKSQDVAFWKELINDEIEFIMGNNTWVLADLPLGVIIYLYVDDMLIFGTDQFQVDLTKEFLSSRPDIAFEVGKLSMYTSNPGTQHWQLIQRVFLLAGGAISWTSKKQTFITGSTIKSEFVALAATGKEAEWLKNVVFKILL